MEPMYIVAIISFLLGVFGYIITQFWIRPILRYRQIKDRIAADLKWYLEAQKLEIKDKIAQEQFRAKVEIIRGYCTALTDCFSYDLPPWYKLLLESRHESPIDASKHLMALANIRNVEHADRRLEKIKKSLQIKF
jgi:hypothetical protein